MGIVGFQVVVQVVVELSTYTDVFVCVLESEGREVESVGVVPTVVSDRGFFRDFSWFVVFFAKVFFILLEYAVELIEFLHELLMRIIAVDCEVAVDWMMCDRVYLAGSLGCINVI